jgi:hypothetical protein
MVRAGILLFSFCAGMLAESVAGLQWTAPAGWKNEGSRPMRAATYSVPASAHDNEPSECVVYFFGAGQGGSVEANIARWKGQFRTAAGGPAEGHVQKRTIHHLPVTTLDISGEYSGMGGPMAASKTDMAGYRLLGAVVEGPGGTVFVKFTGPAKTVAANQQKFEQLIGSFQPAH